MMLLIKWSAKLQKSGADLQAFAFQAKILLDIDLKLFPRYQTTPHQTFWHFWI